LQRCWLPMKGPAALLAQAMQQQRVGAWWVVMGMQ
jgi:hypothetical protein